MAGNFFHPPLDPYQSGLVIKVIYRVCTVEFNHQEMFSQNIFSSKDVKWLVYPKIKSPSSITHPNLNVFIDAHA